MADVLGGVKRLKKTGFNKHHGYAYATDGDVSDLIRDLLHEHGIAFWVNMEGIESWEAHGKQNRMIVKWTMHLENADDPSDCRKINWLSESLDSQDKGINKAATAAVKYFLLKTFIVSTGDESVDSDSAKGEAAPARPMITDKQLAYLKRLVDDTGGAWEGFVDYVKQQTNGVEPKELPRPAAEKWISALEVQVKKRRAADEERARVEAEATQDSTEDGDGEGGEENVDVPDGDGVPAVETTSDEQGEFSYGPPPMTDEEIEGYEGGKPDDTSRVRRNIKK